MPFTYPLSKGKKRRKRVLLLCWSFGEEGGGGKGKRILGWKREGKARVRLSYLLSAGKKRKGKGKKSDLGVLERNKRESYSRGGKKKGNRVVSN